MEEMASEGGWRLETESVRKQYDLMASRVVLLDKSRVNVEKKLAELRNEQGITEGKKENGSHNSENVN